MLAYNVAYAYLERDVTMLQMTYFFFFVSTSKWRVAQLVINK